MAKTLGNSIDNDFSYDPNYVDDVQSPEVETLDIQHYLRILRKHKWPITLFSAVVTGLAAYYAYTSTPVYRATSTLLIESQQQAAGVSLEELIGVQTEGSDYYQTQYELLKSRRLALRVVDHLSLWNNPELSAAARSVSGNAAVVDQAASAEPTLRQRIEGLFGGEEKTSAPDLVIDLSSPEATAASVDSLDSVDTSLAGSSSLTASQSTTGLQQSDLTERQQSSVVAGFMSRLQVAPVRNTKLVKISFESTDPVFAAMVANTVGEQYIDSYLDSKLEMTTRASNWLNDRLGILKLELDESEDKLIAYKQANGLIDVNGSVGRLNEQELLLATNELAEARSALASASDLFNEVRSLRGQPDLLESIVAIQGDPLIQQVKIEQGQRQRELDELLNRYGERHPRVVDAKSRLGSLSATMSGHVNRVIGSIEKNYQLLQQRVASIQNKLSQGKEDILLLGTKRFELDELDREVLTKRDLYNTFYSRITEAKSADGLETANARVSDFAVTPSFPIKPKKQLIIALAALASLLMSGLMALLYEQMDSTIKGIHDVEEKIGLKLLGIMPLIKNGILGKVGARLPLNPLEIEDKKGTFFESINTIRTALSIDDAEHPKKVIIITSSVPGEGKSTTSINLAYSMAQLERVLLIDCDMRRPSIGSSIGLDKSTFGLTSLITGTASAKQCIRRGVFNGHVDLLPSGPLPEQPLEMLSSKRFENILASLSEHYDRIVLDSAPTQAVSDALVLSKLSDALVYVVKSHDTEINLVKRGIQRLKQVNASIAGVVITQVDVDKITAYGGDYYYQGYYDYYGYNNAGGDRNSKLRLTPAEMLSLKTDDREVELDLDYVENSRGDSKRRQMKELDLTQELPDVRSKSKSVRSREDDLDII